MVPGPGRASCPAPCASVSDSTPGQNRCMLPRARWKKGQSFGLRTRFGLTREPQDPSLAGPCLLVSGGADE